MKKFAMILLPPVVVFGVFALMLKYNPLQYTAEALADIGSGTSSGLVEFYKIFMPLLFVIALLSQILIGIPLWRGIKRSVASAFWTIISWLFVCLLLAGGLSYVIWDRPTGAEHLIHITLFMWAVQSIYWLLNFGLLWLIDRPKTIAAQAATNTSALNESAS